MDQAPDRAPVVERYVKYADAITVFAVVQGLAFGLSLTEDRVFCFALDPGHRWWFVGGLLFASILYPLLVGLCAAAERELREPCLDEVVTRWARCASRVRVGLTLLFTAGLLLLFLESIARNRHATRCQDRARPVEFQAPPNRALQLTANRMANLTWYYVYSQLGASAHLRRPVGGS